MPTVVQFRRGSTTQNNAFTGAEGEITIDTTLDTLRVHDGATGGGIAIARSADVTTANVGMIGYVDNSTTTANIGMIGYVDNSTTTANIGMIGYVDNSTTTANIGMIGYVDNSTTTANIGMKGYVDDEISNIPPGYANVQVATYLPTYNGTILTVTTANVGMIGYVDNSTTTANIGMIGYVGQQVTTANIGLKGYADTQLNTKQSTITGAATTIDTENLTVSRALVSDGSGKVAVSAVTSTEIGYLDGVSSAIQTQLNTKAPLASPSFTTKITTPDIDKSGSNGVGDIGQTDNRFATIYGLATSAQYADLAEIYKSDVEYAPGTVVVFGGTEEITQSISSHDRKVAGVISTQPAHVMNATAEGQPIALQGRVPCKTLGPIEQGDMVVTSDSPGVAQKLNDAQYQPGCVLGKSLGTITDNSIQTIEVVVGRV
jgi:hypothetical protein